MGKAGQRGRRLGEVRSFIGELYEPDLHAKRIDALAGATLGVMAAASLAVAMDWTDFDHDGQSTLVLSLVTGHGRAAPLLWLTMWKEEIATRRNDYEDACLHRLAELVPAGRRVTILADRGFGDQKLFAFLGELGFGYVIRFRGNIHVADADGQTKPAAEWVGKGGRARKLRHARVTAGSAGRGGGVRHAKGMNEPWCLAARDPEATPLCWSTTMPSVGPLCQ